MEITVGNDGVKLGTIMRINSTNTISIACTAGLICLLIYLRALFCGFVNFDDPEYVLENVAIRHLNGDLFVWAFGQPHANFWIPLTWVSFALDYHFWGLNPLGYHLTNVVLHAINTGFVVLIADRLLRVRMAPVEKPDYLYSGMLLLAGLIWGLHPLRVESVAWVTERKDVLNGIFSLSALLCYLNFVQDKVITPAGTAKVYLMSLLFFALSLLAKPVSVMLPLMLLMADLWLQRSNIRSLLIEKIPFLLLSVVVSFVTVVLMADSSYLISYDVFPLGQRLIVSGNAIFEYVRLLIYPVGILPQYPFPNPLPTSFTVKGCVAVIAMIVCLWAGRKKTWIIATLGAFIIPLFPTLGFFQNGDQILAARFTYLPSLAPSIAVAAAAALAWKTIRSMPLHWFCAAFLCAILTLYGVTTLRLIAIWDNTGTLWSRVIQLQPMGRAYKDRGIFYLKSGNYPAAIEDLSVAIEIASRAGMPEIFNIYALRGDASIKAGRYDAAVRDFSDAIALFPDPVYFYNRGIALQALGRKNEADDDFRRAGPDPGVIRWFKFD